MQFLRKFKIATLFSILIFSIACSQLNKPEPSVRQLAFDAAYDFAMALRLNDPVAYEMVDSANHSRLDIWMTTHKAQTCSRLNPEGFRGGGYIETGYDIYFDCFMLGGVYLFNVDDIFLEEKENGFIIVDWGAVNEEIP